jgi:hypothetical protein
MTHRKSVLASAAIAALVMACHESTAPTVLDQGAGSQVAGQPRDTAITQPAGYPLTGAVRGVNPPGTSGDSLVIVVGAEVTVRQVSSGALVATTSTANDGRFEFATLPDGRHRLLVTPATGSPFAPNGYEFNVKNGLLVQGQINLNVILQRK